MKKSIVRLIAVGFLLVSGCVGYDAHFEDCTISCTASSGCPEGLACGAEGLCRQAEAPACLVAHDGTGGTITHVGGRTIHTFTADQSGSTFVPTGSTSSIEILVVAGGGGGGSTRGGGGGGGGGVVHMTTFVVDQPSYDITVGRGGSPSTRGSDSVLGTITANGGGSGRAGSPADGGSGGGASHDTNDGPAGNGDPGQGNRGGTSGTYDLTSMIFLGAGGGGSSSIGANAILSGAGAGGAGLALTISGSTLYYGGGGGGGAQDLGNHGLIPGPGGTGAGGDGGVNAPGHDGTDGTGGGGGGGGGGPDPNFYPGGRGGNGVVVISYPTMLDPP